MSYGEARRVLLARAMVHRASLMILDEPCTGLDIPTRETFLETMEKIMQGTNKIVIDNEGGSQGVLPYLPLPELRKQSNRSRGEN